MSTRENLIAARALIDTTEKWAAVKGIIISVALVTTDTKERAAAVKALRSQGLMGGEPLPVILAAYDRAIAALESKEPGNDG